MTTAGLLAIFSAVTAIFNLPNGLLKSVCYVESHYDVKAIHVDDGSADSIGVCQIQIPTARGLGFRGSEEDLTEPFTNAYYSGMYLSNQLRRYRGNVSKSVAAYNAGSWRLNDSGTIKNKGYVDKVLKAWKEGKQHEAPNCKRLSKICKRK